MNQSFVFIIKCFSICLLLLVGSVASATPVKVGSFIEQVDLWEMNFTQFKEKYPDLTWKKAGKTNHYVSQGDDVSYLGQPIEQIRIKVSKEFELLQSIKMVVLSKDKASKMDKSAFNGQAKKWRDAVSRSLKKKSKLMPGIQVEKAHHTRLAWRHGKSTVILAVITDEGDKNIELTYHEKDHGIARLRLEGPQEVESGDEEMPAETAVKTGDANEPKATENRGSSEADTGKVSHATTASLKKKYSITDNFTADWPKLVKTESPEITVVKEDEENNKFIYHSPNYEFICDVALSKNVIKNFSTLFEATRLYCREMPISMVRAQLPEGTEKYKILLFGTKQSYFKNGGPQGSAGVYMPGEGIIMVPLQSLGVKKVGSSYMFDYKVSNKTIPHEITHQLTNIEYYNAGACGWFSEGLAEYIAATGYRSGKFMAGSTLSDIRNYVTEGSRKDGRGRYLGDEFTAPDIKKFMTMTYKQFVANGNFNYGLGTLCTYYFFHMDGDGDRKNINAFLTALNEGKKGEEALKMLLAGRTFDELEEDISAAWRSRGVKIKFK